jgi:hypothetical protein
METTNQGFKKYYNEDSYSNLDQMYCPYMSRVKDEQTYNEPDNEEIEKYRHGRTYYPYYYIGFPPYGYGWNYGWHRDAESNQRHDFYEQPNAQPNIIQPNAQPNIVQPNAQPNIVQPNAQPNEVQPILQPAEKNYKDFKSLENNVNTAEINHIVKQIKYKHPYMMKKLLMMGLAEKECKKIIYLILMCSGKFDL